MNGSAASTLEARCSSPRCRALSEILLGKTIPYFVLGMLGLALCLLGAKFLFDVPFRGSIAVLAIVSMLYLLIALGIGLFISTATKNQFVAIQLTMLVTFLPAMMLSGFLFDLRNMPAVVRVITYVLPGCAALLRRLAADHLPGRKRLEPDLDERNGLWGRDGGPADGPVLPGDEEEAGLRSQE